MSSRRRRRVIAALATTALAPVLVPVLGAAPASAAVEFEVVAEGLDNPRGLAFGPDGSLYVAESGRGGEEDCVETEELGLRCFGATGAVTRVDLDAGEHERVAEGLPSLASEGGAEASGPADLVVTADGRLLVAVGLGAPPAAREEFGAGAERLGTLLSVDPATGAATVVADVAGFEASDDPLPDEAGPDSNPNAVLQVGGETLVADAGGNSVVSVAGDGSVSLVAVFEDRLVDTPPFMPDAPPQMPMEAVPTSLAVGEDGQVLVGQLTGFPFPVGGALVWSLDPAADRPVEPAEFFGGFTTIMDVVQRDDDTFVLEIATNSLLAGEDAVGAIARLRPDGSVQRVGQDTLRFPGGMTVGPDGALYVTNASAVPGEGQVLRLDPSLAADPAIQAACPPDDLAYPPFTDIAGSAHEEAIACLWWWEIVRGTSGSTFSPDQSLTRGQAASLLVRAAERSGVALPTDPADAFTDDEGSVHESAIDRLAAVGVLRGTGAGRVSPGALVTRGQLSSLVVRAAEVLAGQPLPVSGDRFTDDAGSVHEEPINKAATAGWVTGTGSGLFRPQAPITRAQSSTVLARIASTLVEAGLAELPDPVSGD